MKIPMKTRFKLAIVLASVLLLSTGCLKSLLRTIIPDSATPAVSCVVRYVIVAPGLDIGLDDCGNAWLRYAEGDSSYCELISASGDSMIAIACPAAGDSLGL